MILFFDGLNQEPSEPWLQLFKVLQSESFAGRIRVIMSTRTFHYEVKLSTLRGLTVPPIIARVNAYDLAEGGELDQMLNFEGLARSDLHLDLISWAQNPRLFQIVVEFRKRLGESGQVTVHRLLWEYGRDSFGVRAGPSFSEPEWRAWLGEIAVRHRTGIEDFSLKSLGETASRPDLSESEVYARLRILLMDASQFLLLVLFFN